MLSLITFSAPFLTALPALLLVTVLTTFSATFTGCATAYTRVAFTSVVRCSVVQRRRCVVNRRSVINVQVGSMLY